MSLYMQTLGQGKPLVLLHGWGFSHRVWLSLAQLLAHQFQLFLVDLPGFGRSDLLSWEAFKQGLLAELPAQFAIVGWSLGGLYAQRLAVEAPDRITHLIGLASTPYFLQEAAWPGVPATVLAQFFDQLQTNAEKVLRDFIHLHHQHTQKLHLEPPNQDALLQGLAILKAWDLREALTTLKPSASFLFGTLDKIVPISTCDAMAQRYPQFHYQVFPKAGHMLFLSHEAALVDFLESTL